MYPPWYPRNCLKRRIFKTSPSVRIQAFFAFLFSPPVTIGSKGVQTMGQPWNCIILHNTAFAGKGRKLCTKYTITTNNTENTDSRNIARCGGSVASAIEACPYIPYIALCISLNWKLQRRTTGQLMRGLIWACALPWKCASATIPWKPVIQQTLAQSTWVSVPLRLCLDGIDDFSWFLLDRQHLQKLLHSALKLITSELRGSWSSPLLRCMAERAVVSLQAPDDRKNRQQLQGPRPRLGGTVDSVDSVDRSLWQHLESSPMPRLTNLWRCLTFLDNWETRRKIRKTRRA